METADHQWGSSQYLQSLFSGTWILLCSSRFILSVCRQSQCTSGIHNKNFFPLFFFFFSSQFEHAATWLIREAKHFCRTHVLSDSFLYVHKILGNKAIKKISGKHTKPLLSHSCLDTCIYLLAPSDWPVPEQGKDSLLQDKWQMLLFDNFWGPAHRRESSCESGAYIFRWQKAASSRTGIKSRGEIHRFIKAKIENPGLLSMEKYQGNSCKSMQVHLKCLNLCLRDAKS